MVDGAGTRKCHESVDCTVSRDDLALVWALSFVALFMVHVLMRGIYITLTTASVGPVRFLTPHASAMCRSFFCFRRSQIDLTISFP